MDPQVVPPSAARAAALSIGMGLWLALGAACTLPEKPACATTQDCVAGNVCVQQICMSASSASGSTDAGGMVDAAGDVADVAPAPGADASTADAPATTASLPRAYSEFAGYSGLQTTSRWPPGVVAPRALRLDLLAILDAHSNELYHQGIVDHSYLGWIDRVGGTALRGGVDVTFAGVETVERGVDRLDAVTRDSDDVLLYAHYEIGKTVNWAFERLGGVVGALRPAISHLAPRTLVVFQVDFTAHTMYSRKMVDGVWRAWTMGPEGELSAGVDATALYENGVVKAIRLVACDREKHVVTAVYDGATDKLSAWTRVGGDPPDGAAGTPTITTFGGNVDEYEILTPSVSGRVWKRSFARDADDPDFTEVRLPGDAQTVVVDLDAAAMPGLDLIDVHMRSIANRLDHGTIKAVRK